jgi:hypothetical protein
MILCQCREGGFGNIKDPVELHMHFFMNYAYQDVMNICEEYFRGDNEIPRPPVQFGDCKT